MRIRRLAATAAVALLAVPAGTAAADTAIALKRSSPAWYTPQLHARVLAAGANGVPVAEESLNLECPGFATRGVSAAGCIVSPAGCTANFIFSGGRSKYVGTARHCIKGVGSKVVMQVDTATLAVVGSVVKHTSGGGVPGRDFALIRIDPAVASRWGVNPAIPVVGGPNGVYSGCDPQAVKYFGHGYAAAVAQGKPQAGLATNWLQEGYGWTGTGINGDSGSPVVLADGRAAGNFTHIVVDGRYPGSNLAGMRMTAILQFLGSRIRLVAADGASTSSGPATCTSSGGGGGSGGKGGRRSSDEGLPVIGDILGGDEDEGLPVIGDILGGDEDDDDRDDDDRDRDRKRGGGLLGSLGL